MKKFIYFSIFASVFLVACNSQTSNDVVSSDVDTVAVDDSSVAVGASEVPYSELAGTMLQNNTEYAFHFVDGSGDCVDKGFASDFWYTIDKAIAKYPIVKADDDSFVDDYVALGANNLLSRIDDGVKLEGVDSEDREDEGKLSCELSAKTGENGADLKCYLQYMNEDGFVDSSKNVEVCSAKFEIKAKKYSDK